MTRLTIFYDYTDPWCYIAVYRARWLQTQVHELEVVWHPFEVFPDLPPRGARPQNPAFLRRKIQYDVDQLAEPLGLKVAIPTERVFNSRLALAGSLYARRQGYFDAYHRAVFAAFFEQGWDISIGETVAAIGHEIGLDAAELARALESGEYQQEVVRLTAEAEAFGVAAVPTFVANNQGAIGIVSDERLLRIVTTASPPVVQGVG